MNRSVFSLVCLGFFSLALFSPSILLAKTQLISCPVLHGIEQRETSGKGLWQWHTELNSQHWLGRGIHFHSEKKYVSHLSYDGRGKIICRYTAQNSGQPIGLLTTFNHPKACRFMQKHATVHCQKNRYCCQPNSAAGCQVLLCKSPHA